jgi:ketosteroid isomerase-like protein
MAEPATPEELIAAYEQASAAHDLEGVMALLDDRAVYWFSNQSAHVGREAVRGAIAHNFAAVEGEAYALADLRWLVRSEEAAVCVYRYRWRGRIGGREAQGEGRGTSVLARRDAGWRIVHEHLSAGPPS